MRGKKTLKTGYRNVQKKLPLHLLFKYEVYFSSNRHATNGKFMNVRMKALWAFCIVRKL